MPLLKVLEGNRSAVSAPAVTAKGIVTPKAGIETVTVVLSTPVIIRKNCVVGPLASLGKTNQKSVPLLSFLCAFALIDNPANKETITKSVIIFFITQA